MLKRVFLLLSEDSSVVNSGVKWHTNILLKKYEDKVLVMAAQVTWTNSPTKNN